MAGMAVAPVSQPYIYAAIMEVALCMIAFV
jgi:hypothetical protein